MKKYIVNYYNNIELGYYKPLDEKEGWSKEDIKDIINEERPEERTLPEESKMFDTEKEARNYIEGLNIYSTLTHGQISDYLLFVSYAVIEEYNIESDKEIADIDELLEIADEQGEVGDWIDMITAGTNEE